MTLGWREPAHPFATSSCYCGDPECRRCFPWNQKLPEPIECPECDELLDDECETCPACGCDLTPHKEDLSNQRD